MDAFTAVGSIAEELAEPGVRTKTKTAQATETDAPCMRRGTRVSG